MRALIGLAGTYDVGMVSAMARRLFGVSPETDAALSESGNPLLRAGLRPEIPVLLIHGDADDLVPPSFTSEFARALEVGGHAVTVHMVSGADHHEIYSAEASGALIAGGIEEVGRPD